MKLSPMDVASWDTWLDDSKARDAVLAATKIEHAPWSVVDADIKRNARLNVIRQLLGQIDHEGIERDVIEIPNAPTKATTCRRYSTTRASSPTTTADVMSADPQAVQQASHARPQHTTRVQVLTKSRAISSASPPGPLPLNWLM